MPTEPLTLRVPARLKSQLSSWADAEEKSVSAIVIQLLEKAIEETRKNLDRRYEEAKADLEIQQALMSKVMFKKPGECITLDDFSGGELGRSYVEDVLKRPDYYGTGEEGYDNFSDGIPRDFIMGKDGMLDAARQEFERVSKLIEAVGSIDSVELKKQLESDMWDEGKLTNLGKHRIANALKYLGRENVKSELEELGDEFGYKTREGWLKVLMGKKKVSDRAQKKIRDWLERIEDDMGMDDSLAREEE